METISKTEYMKGYMKVYMKKRYHDKHEQTLKYKNSLNVRKAYVIDDATWKKYGHELHSIVTLKETIDSMPEGLFQQFLFEFNSLHFEKRPKKLKDNIEENIEKETII